MSSQKKHVHKKKKKKTLFLAIKKCTGFTTDAIWVNTEVCSVTSEPTHSSSRRVSSLKDSSVLLTIEWWTSQKWSPSNLNFCVHLYYISFKAINNMLDTKMVLKTHLFMKIFRLLYRGFVRLIRISRNIKQKFTQQLMQTN